MQWIGINMRRYQLLLWLNFWRWKPGWDRNSSRLDSIFESTLHKSHAFANFVANFVLPVQYYHFLLLSSLVFVRCFFKTISMFLPRFFSFLVSSVLSIILILKKFTSHLFSSFLFCICTICYFFSPFYQSLCCFSSLFILQVLTQRRIR